MVIFLSKKYYIAADGGGTKLQAILYDESFNVIRAKKTAGVNSLYKPRDVVEKNIDTLIDELLGDEIKVLESADVCLVMHDNYFERSLKARCEVKKFNFHEEPLAALGAAFERRGVVALCGTGSDAFGVYPDGSYLRVGGWGPLFGDEGSGYDIGLQAFKAAFWDTDGRGKHTVMTDMIKEKWNVSDVWDLIGYFAKNPDARHEIASAAMLVSRAAAMGDEVALNIYRYSADQMAITTNTAIRRLGDEWSGVVVTMGSAWKGHPVMFEDFCQKVKAEYPSAKITLPVFEPVVGCAVQRCFGEGLSAEDIKEKMLIGFSDYIYKI